jgi:hypothetical protein
MHRGTRLLQNLSGSNTLEGTELAFCRFPLDLQRDSVVVDYDGPAAAHRSGDDLSYSQGRAGSVL